jgi:glycosyltransferase involved in cell wall biosynthesis
MMHPLVSIIINTYNYARFLPFAIESSLAQTYPHIEVIVVDDGSTDGSNQVLAGYADRLTVISKANGGQASAFNRGFHASHGDYIFFLDADDTLAPTVVAQVVERFQQQPTPVRVLFRLAIMTADGKATGATTPPRTTPLPNGHLIPRLLQSPDDIAWSPTSGNAFTRSVLEAILPIPEAEYPICADYYLSALTPLFGVVATLAETGGCYRVHGQNYHHATTINLARRHTIITLTAATHRHLRRLATRQGYAVPEHFHSFSYLAHRLISLKSDAHAHPLPGDSISMVLTQVCHALRDTNIPLSKRIQYGGWFLATAMAPSALVPLLDTFYFKAP